MEQCLNVGPSHFSLIFFFSKILWQILGALIMDFRVCNNQVQIFIKFLLIFEIPGKKSVDVSTVLCNFTVDAVKELSSW